MATLWQLSNSYKSSSVSPTTLATYFLYIVSLISIDLELSRLFNSLHCKAYSYEPGLPTVLYLICTFSAY